MDNDYNVLHLPTTVGGNPQGISNHLNELGVQSETWTIRQNYFGYPADKVIVDSKDSIILAELKKLLALRYVFMFNVVFFNFGSSLFKPYPLAYNNRFGFLKIILYHFWYLYTLIMQRLEFFLLKALDRKCFVQYQGDDARQGDYCKEYFNISVASQVENGYYTKKSDSLKRKQIKLFEQNRVKIYALNPDLLHVLPIDSEFLPYSHISLREWSPYYTQLDERPIRIGHAPTHRGAKGTDLIIKAVENLKEKGFNFEFVLVEGLSNTDAKEKYKTIDVLVDQLFAGWYGGLAVEVMALGKPVIVYIREEDLKFIPEGMKTNLPFFKTTPDDIELTIKYVLELPRKNLLEVAKKSRYFVERWHDPLEIASRIKNDIEIALKK
jgi:glycosyltransferase involved in cell wall biosynthesis